MSRRQGADPRAQLDPRARAWLDQQFQHLGHVPRPLSRDQWLGRRAAAALAITVIVFAVLGPLLWALNVLLAVTAGVEPHAAAAGSLQQWRGLVPLPLPWWVLPVPALGLAVILALTWRQSRWVGPERSGTLLLWVNPALLGVLALLCAGACLGNGVLYTASGLGLHWISAVLCAAVGAAGMGRMLVHLARRGIE